MKKTFKNYLKSKKLSEDDITQVLHYSKLWKSTFLYTSDFHKNLWLARALTLKEDDGLGEVLNRLYFDAGDIKKDIPYFDDIECAMNCFGRASYAK